MRKSIDSHLRLLYPDRLHYDWTQSLPALQRTFEFEEYASIASAAKITGALHMEVDVRESEIEAELVRNLAGTRILVGAISACRPKREDIRNIYRERN